MYLCFCGLVVGRCIHTSSWQAGGLWWDMLCILLHLAVRACMCVCMCVCLCLRDIPLAYRQDSSCFSAYSVWISIILPVAQRCSLTHLPFHSLSLFYWSLVPTPHICTQHTEQSPHTTITPSQYRFIWHSKLFMPQPPTLENSPSMIEIHCRFEEWDLPVWSSLKWHITATVITSFSGSPLVLLARTHTHSQNHAYTRRQF